MLGSAFGKVNEQTTRAHVHMSFWASLSFSLFLLHIIVKYILRMLFICCIFFYFISYAARARRMKWNDTNAIGSVERKQTNRMSR